MITVLVILHIIFCVVLILVVLLQAGKGADIGAAFGGGSSQAVFGPRAGSYFLTKATAVVAVLFMLTSLSLTFLVARKADVSTLMEQGAGQTAVRQKEPAEEGKELDAAHTRETKSPGNAVSEGDAIPSSPQKQ